MSSICKKNNTEKSFEKMFTAVEISRNLKIADDEKFVLARLEDFCQSNCPNQAYVSCPWAKSELAIDIIAKECHFLKVQKKQLDLDVSLMGNIKNSN